jgi:hypothetical protein
MDEHFRSWILLSASRARGVEGDLRGGFEHRDVDRNFAVVFGGSEVRTELEIVVVRNHCPGKSMV